MARVGETSRRGGAGAWSPAPLWGAICCGVLTLSALAAWGASFDCAKAKTEVEKLICTNGLLDSLDNQMHNLYTYVMKTVGESERARIRAEQREWLKRRDTCKGEDCLVESYKERMKALEREVDMTDVWISSLPPDPPIRRTPEGFVGEYFVTQSKGPVCVAFTRNLNQFRKLHFDECHPRLSEKFPEFSRPEWTEIPFDLSIAKLAVAPALVWDPGKPLKKSADWYLQRWLRGTESLRANSQIKMWQTKIDIDNDGKVDTLIRVQYANPASSLPVADLGCTYSGSGLYLAQAATDKYRVNFSRGLSASDVIYYAPAKRYYLVHWAEANVGPGYDGRNIGATRGVILYEAQFPLYGPVEQCLINWVPTGEYRPLKRPLKKPADNDE
jgi:uncharacterized protein YecT (DUF1311 family)